MHKLYSNCEIIQDENDFLNEEISVNGESNDKASHGESGYIIG